MHTDAKRNSSGGRRSGGQSNLHRGSQRSKAKGTTKVQDDLSQDLLHPAWRWQCDDMQCGICARSERTFDEKIYLLPHRDDSKKSVSRHHLRTQDPMSS